ncbi:helix-turn-helix domain-containing protein [Rhodanobacter sp. FDAARGOS 1247]|uniref:helix-turn-helix domain-containing protein n=1 Tax=unclassified Rhodanobacter TaxID=2621553 RepID=UPI0006FC83FA|nr:MULTISPECIES: helix-turn-helix domain-containing protein [unclassified Rhodanobacter]KQZ71068.1 transcriptional regulator [Rhodanobacter sp. Root561]QRP63405.1 helix-turn-helix domain-containing protein [Rhodanobacter sp. FDAARGOS 1247]
MQFKPTPGRPGRLPEPRSPIADDGDETRFCGTCAFSSACIAAGYDKPELAELQCLVEHVGPFRVGEHIFRTGDPFRAIFAVRSGTVKTRMVDKEGREQVLGFYLPGEVIGLNAIYPEHFPCDAVALDTAYFCRFSFPAMSALASRVPAVQQHLFRMLSKELGTASLLAGDHSADERVAAFLLDLGNRYAVRGFSGSQFHLSMSRGDIANYLRLAAETVSRVLSRFRAQKLIAIEGRELELLNVAALRKIGEALLPD